MTPAICAYCGGGDAWDLSAYVEREREVDGRTVYNRRFRCSCARGRQHREIGTKPRALYATADGIGDAEADKFGPCLCPGGRCGRPGCLECAMASEQPATQFTRTRDAGCSLAVRDKDAEHEVDLPTPDPAFCVPVEQVHAAIDLRLETFIIRAHTHGLHPMWVYSNAWVGQPPITFGQFQELYLQVVLNYLRDRRTDIAVPLPGELKSTARALAAARDGLAGLLAEQSAAREAARAALADAQEALLAHDAGLADLADAVGRGDARAALVAARDAAATALDALVKRHELAAPKIAQSLAGIAREQLAQRRHEIVEAELLMKWAAGNAEEN